MFRELDKVSQRKGERRRRWFQSEEEDLIVWYADDGSLFGFQLCYDRTRTERALTWLPPHGFLHNRVDDGEGGGLGYKRTPLLVADGVFDAATMSGRFRHLSASLPGEIAAFVLNKLEQLARAAPASDFQPAARFCPRLPEGE